MCLVVRSALLCLYPSSTAVPIYKLSPSPAPERSASYLARLRTNMRGGGARLAFASRLLLLALAAACTAGRAGGHGVQPLSRVAIHRARVALDASAAVRASPSLLGSRVRLVEFPFFHFFLLPFTSTTTLAASITPAGVTSQSYS